MRRAYHATGYNGGTVHSSSVVSAQTVYTRGSDIVPGPDIVLLYETSCYVPWNITPPRSNFVCLSTFQVRRLASRPSSMPGILLSTLGLDCYYTDIILLLLLYCSYTAIALHLRKVANGKHKILRKYAPAICSLYPFKQEPSRVQRHPRYDQEPVFP